MMGMRSDGEGGGARRHRVGCHEDEGSNVAIGGRFWRPGIKTRRKNCWQALSLSQSRRMSVDLEFFGLTKEVARPIAHSFSTNRRGGDCWGWPRLVRVSVSSTNTYPPPKVAAYSASATDAITTGMGWQKARRGALWVTGWSKSKDGWDCKRREERIRVCLVLELYLWLSGGG
jgi:hypothetical protein